MSQAPQRTRAEIARANGAKSRGPITPEGKARSSQNARRHGLFDRQLLLPNESSADYLELHRSHLQQFHPQTPVESELVSAMTLARWRSLRLALIEANLFNHELESLGPEIDSAHPNLRLSCAFERLARTSLGILLRYQALAERTYERALEELLSLRAQIPPRWNEPRIVERAAQQFPSCQGVAVSTEHFQTNPGSTGL